MWKRKVDKLKPQTGTLFPALFTFQRWIFKIFFWLPVIKYVKEIYWHLNFIFLHDHGGNLTSNQRIYTYQYYHF